MDIRSLQRPLKDTYRQAPAGSKITLVAHGRKTDVPTSCSIDLGRSMTLGHTKASEGRVPAPAPAIYSYQNQDAPRSDARPVAPRPAHKSVRAASAISWPPTPPAPNDRPKKLIYAFSSNAAFSDGDPMC